MTTIARTVERDETLPHQIIIGTGRHEGEFSVSCNCRKFGGGNHGYSPMAHVPTGDGAVLECQRIYNVTSNHYPVEGEPPFHPDLNNYKKIKHVEVAE
jgi:hypothetical protein